MAHAYGYIMPPSKPGLINDYLVQSQLRSQYITSLLSVGKSAQEAHCTATHLHQAHSRQHPHATIPDIHLLCLLSSYTTP
eukprot:620681-Pelagomonas_calceolata.AAC.4